MISELLKERALPPFEEREKMLDTLLREEYGYLPPKPTEMTWEVKENYVRNFCAGKADMRRVDITCRMERGDFTFPVYASIPRGEGKFPFFRNDQFSRQRSRPLSSH